MFPYLCSCSEDRQRFPFTMHFAVLSIIANRAELKCLTASLIIQGLLFALFLHVKICKDIKLIFEMIIMKTQSERFRQTGNRCAAIIYSNQKNVFFKH